MRPGGSLAGSSRPRALVAENGRGRPVRRRRWGPRGVEPLAALMMGPEAHREGAACEGEPVACFCGRVLLLGIREEGAAGGSPAGLIAVEAIQREILGGGSRTKAGGLSHQPGGAGFVARRGGA